MCAYPLACYRFPGSKAIFHLVQTALMFSTAVTAIPSLHHHVPAAADRQLSCLDPSAIASPLGLFLMKQFIDQIVHPALLESADLDGAGELTKCFRLVFPMVKPAWITLAIFSVQTLWVTGNHPLYLQ